MQNLPTVILQYSSFLVLTAVKFIFVLTQITLMQATQPPSHVEKECISLASTLLLCL